MKLETPGLQHDGPLIADHCVRQDSSALVQATKIVERFGRVRGVVQESFIQRNGLRWVRMLANRAGESLHRCQIARVQGHGAPVAFDGFTLLAEEFVGIAEIVVKGGDRRAALNRLYDQTLGSGQVSFFTRDQTGEVQRIRVGRLQLENCGIAGPRLG